MNLKPAIMSLLIFVVLVVITGTFTQHATSSESVLGAFAPTLPPAFLTFYLIILLLFSKTIIDGLAALLAAAAKANAQHGGSLWFFSSLIAVLCVTVAIGVLMRTNPATLLGVLNAVQEAVAILNSISSQQLSRTTQTSAHMLFLTYYSFFAFGAIVLISLALFLTAFQRAVTFSREDADVGYDKISEKATEIVGKAMTTLESGADYHDVIIICYKQMCILLATAGFEIGLTETAREFSEQVCRKLRMGKEAVKGLTFLFEEARYSQHSVGNDKRSTAITLLASLKHELTRVAGKFE